MILRFAILGLLAPLCISDFAFAATLHVPADYPTIQSCIDAATSGQDECIVAPGTYNELINFLGKAITLRSSDGPTVTTIDGTGLNGSVVKFASGEALNSVMDGLTISDGYSGKGGGVYCENSSPTLRQCTIRNNQAGSFGFGGGVYCKNSSPWLDRCVIRDNKVAGSGGGIYCWLNSSPLIENCLITNNKANVNDLGGDGGGIYCYSMGSRPIIRNCVITGNEARLSGGGVYGGSETLLQITDCLITDNFSVMQIGDTGGGGISCAGDGSTIRNCAILRNSTQFEGGGIDAKGQITVSECIIAGNSTKFLGGGAIFWGDGGSIRNSLIYDNSAEEGGGLVTHSASPTVQNCTFTLNRAENGGALHIRNDSQPMIANAVLWNNEAPLGQEIAIAGVEAVLTVRFSTVAYGAAGVYRLANVGMLDWQNGNSDQNPLFKDVDGADDILGTTDDELRLSSDSPAINAGDPSFVPPSGETDLDGHARVLCGRVDMGAYEFGIGDFDCNQIVDLVDVAAWEGCASDPSAVPSPRPSPLKGERDEIGGHAFRGLAPPATHHRPFGAGPHSVTLPPWARPLERGEGVVDPPLSPLIKGGGIFHPGPLPRGEGAVGCEAFDFDADGDVDLSDFAKLMLIIAP